MTLTRDQNAIAEFASAYAQREGLGPQAVDALAARIAAHIDWLKAFRRTLGATARYPANHQQRGLIVNELARETQQLLATHGRLDFALTPDGSRTAEGFALPAGVEPEFNGYTLYPLFRDGLRHITLARGLALGELTALLGIVAARGEVDGDAFTWLWLRRTAGLHLSAAPSMTAEEVTSIAGDAGDDPGVDAFVATLVAADPFYSSSDGRTTFSADTLDALTAQGIDAERSRALLLTAAGGEPAPPMPGEATARLRALFAHDGDRTARLEAITRVHRGGR